jgi:hypothetical protein
MFLRQPSFFFPTLPHGIKELFSAGLYLPDKCLVAGVFMARGPQDHFRQHWRQVNPFRRQGVYHFSAIGGISFRLDNFVGFQPAQPVGQNIGGDFFFGVQKFVKRLISAEHHVSQDQERPPIAQHFHRSVQRASGTALGRRFLFLHELSVATITCTLQVRLADCLFGGEIKA